MSAELILAFVLGIIVGILLTVIVEIGIVKKIISISK